MSTPDSALRPATRDQDDPAPMDATAHLLGGLHDGDEWPVPAHCHRIDLPDGTHYAFCPHASALHGRDTFRHSTLDPFLCAR